MSLSVKFVCEKINHSAGKEKRRGKTNFQQFFSWSSRVQNINNKLAAEQKLSKLVSAVYNSFQFFFFASARTNNIFLWLI